MDQGHERGPLRSGLTELASEIWNLPPAMACGFESSPGTDRKFERQTTLETPGAKGELSGQPLEPLPPPRGDVSERPRSRLFPAAARSYPGGPSGGASAACEYNGQWSHVLSSRSGMSRVMRSRIRSGAGRSEVGRRMRSLRATCVRSLKNPSIARRIGSD